MSYRVHIGETEYEVKISETPDHTLQIRVGDEQFEVDYLRQSPSRYHLIAKNQVFDIYHSDTGNDRFIYINGQQFPYTFQRGGNGKDRARKRRVVAGPFDLKATMPGKVVKLLVESGEQVEANQPLIVLEAMKMENELLAPHPGTIEKVTAKEGENVENGQKLLILNIAPPAA